MKIEDEQLSLLKLATQYIKKLENLGVDVAMSSFCYMNTNGVTPGNCKLKNLQLKKKFNLKYFFIIFKHLFLISTLHSFKIFNENNKKNFGNIYDKLIISWAIKKDFKEDGSFSDSKFGINSKDHMSNLWFLIYLDELIPSKVDSNIIIFYKNKNKKKYNIYYLAKVIIKSILRNKKSLFKILHELSLQSHFAAIVTKIIKKIVISNDFKSVIMPYEAQPFQNKVFQEVKNINKKIKTIGYLVHTVAFPAHVIHRAGAPDIIFSHSYSEVIHLKNNLSWPQKKLHLIPSLKFKNDKQILLDEKIFVPYSIMNKKIIIKEFEKLLQKQENNSLKPLKIRNHPYMSNSKNHKIFIKNLDNVIKRNASKFSQSSKKSLSIFFCETYAVLEALERGVEVVHICSDPVFESYSEKLWSSIKVAQVSKYIFCYRLKEKGHCINFGTEEDSFNKYFNNI
jgi:hypothetical protein